jgi:copper chaperone
MRGAKLEGLTFPSVEGVPSCIDDRSGRRCVMAVREEALGVTGMTCAGCESRVNGALTSVDGVVRAEADHDTDRVVVRYDPGRVSRDILEQKITESGYDLA